MCPFVYICIMKQFRDTNYYLTEDGDVYSGVVKLNPPVYSKGYKMLKVYQKDAPMFRISVHRAVAECFIPNPDNKPVVNHKDGDKLNNSVPNLEWVTQHENHLHAAANGLKARGETHGNSKLKESDILVIREMLSNKVPQRRIAKLFFVGQATIKNINIGKTWKHIGL